LVVPETKAASAAQLASGHANRAWPLAGSGSEFKVNRHYFAEAIEHLRLPTQPFDDLVLKVLDQMVTEGDLD
jgi:hypothetical protein